MLNIYLKHDLVQLLSTEDRWNKFRDLKKTQMCFEFLGRFILTRYQCQNTVYCCSQKVQEASAHVGRSLQQFEKPSVPKTL